MPGEDYLKFATNTLQEDAKCTWKADCLAGLTKLKMAKHEYHWPCKQKTCTSLIVDKVTGWQIQEEPLMLTSTTPLPWTTLNMTKMTFLSKESIEIGELYD